MKRFTLMAIAALALIFAVTSCNDKPEKGSITFQLKGKSGEVLRNDEPQQLPLEVVIMPVNTEVKAVSFVFKGTKAGVLKEFEEIDVKKDKAGNPISGLKGDVAIVLDASEEPLKSAKNGMQIATYMNGEYTFAVKTKDNQTFTFMFKIAPPEWAKTFQGVKIFNINADGNGSLNLLTGKTVSISDNKNDRYLMNNSTGVDFNAGFTSESVTINGKTYEGNGCLFYKVMAADNLTFDSDPITVAGVVMPKVASMTKTMDGLEVNDLVVGYRHVNDKREGFLIKVKAIDENEGSGSKGSMTLEWKYYAY